VSGLDARVQFINCDTTGNKSDTNRNFLRSKKAVERYVNHSREGSGDETLAPQAGSDTVYP